MIWFLLGALAAGVAGSLVVLLRRDRRSAPLPADHPDGIDYSRDPSAGGRSNDHIAGHHGNLSGLGYP
jgi:hypothetical protein